MGMVGGMRWHEGLQCENSHACADDTIITWSDPELGTDIALSFQEAVGCSYIWCGPDPACGSLSTGCCWHTACC